MGVRTARRGRGLLDRPVGGAPGACVRPRRRDRAGEQGARQSSRQPRRAGLQRVRPERRGAHWVPGCYAPERAELPRAGLRLDARHLERLHELHGRRPQPRRHARGEETDLEGIRRGPAADWVDGAVARPLCEEARAVPLLPACPRTAGAPTPDRAAGAAHARPGGRPPAQLRARRPGSLPRHARLLGRDGRRVAEAFPAAVAERFPARRSSSSSTSPTLPTPACRRSHSARWCEPTRTPRA